MQTDWKQDRIKDQYYIDRYGKCHYYTGNDIKNVVSIHYEIAHKLYPQIKYPKSPEDELKRLGWILMGSTCYHNPIIQKEPTQAQLNKLDKLGKLEYLLILEGSFYVNYNENKK